MITGKLEPTTGYDCKHCAIDCENMESICTEICPGNGKILTITEISKAKLWQCKYCGEHEEPKCHKCVREDGKLVSDELAD